MGDTASEDAFKMEVFSHSEKHHSLQLTPYALPHAILVVSGTDLIVGLKYDELTGDNLRSKIAQLYGSSLNDVMALAGRTGFVAKLSDTCPALLLVPAGFVVLRFTFNTSLGLQWSFFAGKQDCATIARLQKAITSSYPEANSLTMQSLHELIASENA